MVSGSDNATNIRSIMQQNNTHSRSVTNTWLSCITIAFFFLLVFTLQVQAQTIAEEKTSGTEWAFLSGYGSSHPGWGETETRVETIDLVLRRSSILIDNIGGDAWYSGYHSLFLELPVHFLVNYSGPPMIGINFLASYTFTATSVKPYVFIGGGPVYVDADIPGMGSDWNGNYQLGAGLRVNLNDDHSLLFEARYHHISNANTSDPNEPLNSTKFLFGITF